ncbi:MAG: arginine deiminase family protein [Candidatus Nanopelagicales bacterium]|nr:arginine deiminase family protein [Candidatus Nanopelagicales bacterium]
MSVDYGVTSMVAPLKRVAVRPPSPRGDYSKAHWAQPLDLDLLATQHADFVALLTSLGVGIEILHPADDMPDAIFTYDPVFVVPSGVIEFQGAKEVRVGEPPLLAAELEGLGVPRVGQLTGAATADGGDMFWLDNTTLAIGRSYRTNQAAVDQIRAMVSADGINVEVFDLPHDQGPEYCLHLMSVVSPIRDDLAVVFERLAPVALLQALAVRGIETISVPDEDYESLGCNVLTVAPGVVVIAEGNESTATLLRNHGVSVHTYNASEINKGEGGPTCLTRPIHRA